jgi:hypothetical protein
MRRAPKLAITSGCAAVIALVTVAALLVASDATTNRPSGSAAITPHPAAGKPATGSAGNSRSRLSSSSSRLTPVAVIRSFATSYAAFLDGGPLRLPDASLTTTSQAQQAGRIPVGFRDGNLRVTAATALQVTCCSAEQTLTIANRQERYPFTVVLLDDGAHGWQIASLTAPDLSIDDHLQPVARDAQPGAVARRAARQFAVTYVAFKADTGPEPAMSATARRELAASQDSLAGAKLPRGPVSLQSIKFGPPSGSEFAATASVKIAASTQTFTFLMVRQDGGWVAGAFL